MKKALTQKQHNFVNHYVSNNFNAYKAAKSAGYSEKYADSQSSSLINKHPIIRERVQRAYEVLSTELEQELAITLTDKIKKLAMIINDIIPENGEIKHKYLSEGIKAIAELSKMQGHYAPDRRLQVNVDVTKERLLEAKKVYDEY